DGATRTLHAARGVILCLGAFGSPHLLMRSGIGPAAHLRARGIAVLHDLPGVGSALFDHPNLPLRFGLRDPALSFARLQRLDRTLGMGLRYLLGRRGPAAAPFWSCGLFHGCAPGRLPDLEVFFTPMATQETPREGAGSGRSGGLGAQIIARGKRALPGVQFDVNLLRPASCGTVRLAQDPDAPPLIDPALCRETVDIDALAAGRALVRRLVAQPALAAVLTGPIAGDGTPLAAEEDIRAAVTTGHHPVSTCRIGADGDAGAVLDAAFRLRGLAGLRVVDASAFPDQISANPTATVIMMAERAADMIAGRPPPPPDDPRRAEA
ncbi:MAG: GMC family oxidoreductase, partial [Gemmobacter sp.]